METTRTKEQTPIDINGEFTGYFYGEKTYEKSVSVKICQRKKGKDDKYHSAWVNVFFPLKYENMLKAIPIGALVSIKCNTRILYADKKVSYWVNGNQISVIPTKSVNMTSTKNETETDQPTW